MPKKSILSIIALLAVIGVLAIKQRVVLSDFESYQRFVKATNMLKEHNYEIAFNSYFCKNHFQLIKENGNILGLKYINGKMIPISYLQKNSVSPSQSINEENFKRGDICKAMSIQDYFFTEDGICFFLKKDDESWNIIAIFENDGSYRPDNIILNANGEYELVN